MVALVLSEYCQPSLQVVNSITLFNALMDKVAISLEVSTFQTENTSGPNVWLNVILARAHYVWAHVGACRQFASRDVY